MNLIIEFKDVITLQNPNLKFHCKVFEDNRSCIKVAESPKLAPRTKHITIKYHHFRSFFADGSIQIFPIENKDQLADIFMQPLDRVIFVKLRILLMVW